MMYPTKNGVFRSRAPFVSALLASIALLTTGCFFRPADTLRRRASYDLQCPEGHLEFTELGGNCGEMLGNEYTCTLAVRGCDRSATYVHIPNADWIMNSSGGERPAPQ